MVSSKNTHKITLPSFDSGDFSGRSATSSASFTNTQLWPKYLRRWILGVYVHLDHLGNRNKRLTLRARDVYTSVPAVI